LDLRKLVDDRMRIVNQINDCLKEFYPQALGLFYKPACAISITFLQIFSDPNTLLATTKRRFRAFLKKQNYPYLEKADELYGKIHAPAPQADPVMVQTRALR